MIGLYVTTEAPGAYRNGTRVKKIRQSREDAHKPGALATVLGSVSMREVLGELAGHYSSLLARVPFFYFVEWDDTPGHAVGIVCEAIEALS